MIFTLYPTQEPLDIEGYKEARLKQRDNAIKMQGAIRSKREEKILGGKRNPNSKQKTRKESKTGDR